MNLRKLQKSQFTRGKEGKSVDSKLLRGKKLSIKRLLGADSGKKIEHL